MLLQADDWRSGDTGAPGAGFCDACFTGSYPVDVPVTLRKHVLEEPTVRPGTPVQTAID